MAQFGWAYIDCSDTGSVGSGSAGPPYSLQFVTESGGATTGSSMLTYYTASTYGYSESTLVLSGTLIVTGTISASTYHIEDIAIIDATGSTYFGDSGDDVHYRTGSFALWDANTTTPYLTSSAYSLQTFVRGFGANYASVAADYTVRTQDHVIGCQTNNNNQTISLPSASIFGPGALLVVKDEVDRGAYKITLTCSGLAATHTIDGESSYILTGSRPAISLYSNGTNWFVF
jgi:hypothetical protein